MKRALSVIVFAVFAATGCGKNPENAVGNSGPIAAPAPRQFEMPVSPAKPRPDYSKALDSYTAIQGPQDLDTIAMAFSTLPVTDDEKFRVTPEASTAKDAFAKHDLMPKVLPAIDAQVAAAKKQRYYRLDVFMEDSRFTFDIENKHVQWGGWSPMSDPYDFERKGFPVSCPNATVETNRTRQNNYFERVNFEPVKAVVPPTTMHGPFCLLPVDEPTAKSIEAIRAHTGQIKYGRASLYFFVVDAMPGGFPSEVHAVLTHFDAVVVDPSNPKTELAHVSVSLSDPGK